MAVIVIGEGAVFGAKQVEGIGNASTQSTTETKSANEVQALDASGAIIAVALTQIQEEVTVEALLTEGSSINIGDPLGGGFVSGVTITSSNTDFQKVSVTIKRYADISSGA